jgi:phage terminase small subunit
VTPKQARFVAEYLKDLNGKQAAIRTGYSPKTAEIQASRLLSNPKVAAAVSAQTAKQLGKLNITAEMVKERLALIAFQDIRKLHDEHGNLKPIHLLPDDAAAFVAGLEVIKKNAAAGDGVIDTVHKIKVVDPVKALEMLAKHFGLLIERVEHSGGLEISWKDTE